MANIKQSSSGVRSKPPLVRSCYMLRTRPGNSLDTGQSSDGSGDKITMSKEISECLSCWLTYLQMLNGLCCAGSRLSHCLASLVNSLNASCGDSQTTHVAHHCQASWDELSRATSLASGLVKHHVLGPLQDNPDDSVQAIAASVTTFVRLQNQFCYRCCELLSNVASSSSPPCCSLPESSGNRHDPECLTAALLACFAPPPPQALPNTIATQRRWSEAAAAEMGGESSSETQRRWSMPWESSRQWRGNKLTVPPATSLASGVSGTTTATTPIPHDRSRSTTPDSVWHASLASQEELHDVIELLSYRPCCSSGSQPTQLCHGSQHLPGVTLTNCSIDTPTDISPNTGGTCSGSRSRQGSLSPRPSWSSESPGYNWSDQEGAMANLELAPDPHISRKSSSSTDSSSNYSLQSRHSTSSEAGDPRSQLYSMWSGSDLSFTKLAESNESPDTGNHPESNK